MASVAFAWWNWTNGLSKPRMVLSGTVEIDFHGSLERFATGQGLTIQAGDGHKARAIGGIVRLVFFDEA